MKGDAGTTGRMRDDAGVTVGRVLPGENYSRGVRFSDEQGVMGRALLGENPYRPWPARITSITDLTAKEKLFEFRLIDPAIREGFRHTAGQFVELSIFGVGEAPISISSAPSKQGFIELCVRDSGSVTGALHRMKCGDCVGLRGPFGRGFPFEQMRGHDVLLVAGGLGIAPLKSLINHIHDERHDFGKVTIAYGSRTPADIMFLDQFMMWQHRQDFDLHLLVSQPDEDWTGETGYVTQCLEHLEINPLRTYGAIVGPPVMYKSVIEEMRRKGISYDMIYMSFERHMKCGMGKCGHCAVGHQYICVDGPVFNYWEAKNIQGAI
jgi:NAD(P)H-flavin reductase